MTSIGRTRLLTAAFFDRDPRRVARALLGKLLIRKTRGKILAGRIVETEAYLGAGDEAAHSFAGKTARNAVLFGPPGFAYVYFIYGSYFCFNVSCLPDGEAGGVLFRALEPIAGIESMAKGRGMPPWDNASAESARASAAMRLRLERRRLRWLRNISSGPGRMCEALSITRDRDNGKNLVSAKSDLQIVEDDYRVRRVAVGPRVGITKAAEEQLRYLIADNPFVSVPMRTRVKA
ncbi:MAG: DNA-3-methyladenine glycosylase [Terriglobales bacterium]